MKIRHRLYKILVVLLALMLVFGIQERSTLPPLDAEDRMLAQTYDLEYAFGQWIYNALRIKVYNLALGADLFMTDAARRKLVEDYLQLIDQIQHAAYQMNVIYADPQITDKKSASAAIRTQLDQLKAQRDQLAPYAEGVLQDQVSYVVKDIGLGLGGQPVPPVLFRMTPLPNVLIVSPRNVIQHKYGVALVPDLSVDQMQELEDRVDAATGMSSLVVPIGGMGLYPTMIDETSNIQWLSEVVSHEWVHNYLELRPLGISYGDSPEMGTINETTAATADSEMRNILLKDFYPDQVPPPPPTTPPADNPTSPPASPPPFNYQREMHTTRVEADRLLAEGKVADAEAYMEARRKVFWDQGYYIRKLNQAYFAFYGSYADQPYGAAGEDPAGAAVRAYRAGSPSLADFLYNISWFWSFDRLKQAVQTIQQSSTTPPEGSHLTP